MYRNEEYDKKIGSIYKLHAEKRYDEAKRICMEMLAGDLKYRCNNAEFWICYAMIERVRSRWEKGLIICRRLGLQTL